MDRWSPYYVNVPRWSKRCILFLVFLVIFWLIFGSSAFRYLFWHEEKVEDTSCEISPLIQDLYEEVDQANAWISNYPSNKPAHSALFVGNGYIGIPLNGDFSLYIKSGRTLSLHIPYYPAVKIPIPISYTEQTALHYTNGIAIIDKCYRNKLRVSYTYFTHRTIPSIFVQEITFKNAFNEPFIFNLEQKGHTLWDSTSLRTITLYNNQKNDKEEYIVVTGKVLDYSTDNLVIVSVTSTKIPTHIQVPALQTYTYTVYTSVSYNRVKRDKYNDVKGSNENKSIFNLKLALAKRFSDFKESHINVWNRLWNTGFSISESKADGALNGDKINATVYYVLSSVPAPYYEETSLTEVKAEHNSLSYAEGCYGSNHHTLEAGRLWKSMETIEDVNDVVSLWLLTLEKQGCDRLVQAGADGVMQAMVLSFGSFRFNKQHLEFNMHPSFLHRTYRFRRINYGNQTHVNVTVEIDDNDKAMLYVALDRSDKNYYACDGGCLDHPVQLGPESTTFPVKLTKPFTAILYITSDKQHMEDLRHTLHVNEVAEAPVQERNKIILHKHGHHLGGLPTFFWISIFTLIVIFHLFLMKLIYNEYWNQDKYKQRSQDYRPSLKYRLLR